MQTLHPGQIFDKQYRVQKLLGVGKYKQVYLLDTVPARYDSIVHHWFRRDSRLVLKIMEIKEQVEGEVNRLLQMVPQKNIATIYNFCINANPPYLIEEYLQGDSLEKTLLSQSKACIMTSQITNALDLTHGVQVVHNDIHPGNIFLCGRTAKLTDFGNSLIHGKTQPNDHCKTKYRAPETFDSAPIPASDIWSLGVVLYEQLAGRRPFEQDKPHLDAKAYQKQMRDKIMHDSPIPLRQHGISPKLDELVRAMLDKDPAKRPTAKEVKRALFWPSCLTRIS